MRNLKLIGYVTIVERIETNELETLDGHIDWFVEHFGAHADRGRADLVDYAAALDNTFGAEKHKIDLLQYETHARVENERAVDAYVFQVFHHANSIFVVC